MWIWIQAKGRERGREKEEEAMSEKIGGKEEWRERREEGGREKSVDQWLPSGLIPWLVYSSRVGYGTSFPQTLTYFPINTISA